MHHVRLVLVALFATVLFVSCDSTPPPPAVSSLSGTYRLSNGSVPPPYQSNVTVVFEGQVMRVSHSSGAPVSYTLDSSAMSAIAASATRVAATSGAKDCGTGGDPRTLLLSADGKQLADASAIDTPPCHDLYGALVDFASVVSGVVPGADLNM